MGNKVNISSIKGMGDILPDAEAPGYLQSGNWNYVYEIFREMANSYGYKYIETPECERLDLFKRTSGESSDVVSKEMFSWKQRNDYLCLRPEGSASVCRAVIQSGLVDRIRPLKVWYRSPMFRHERPQLGRYRRHVQLGLELFGEEGAYADCEIIYFLMNFYKKCGLSGLSLNINSVGDSECRPRYREEIVNYVENKFDLYCNDCQRRVKINPLRILDCKNKKCQELSREIPPITNYLCSSCRNHFELLQQALTSFGISYVVNPSLVRGLDYYTKTAFEVMIDNEIAQMQTLCGGGRYDGLFETLGGRQNYAVGFGAGIERLLLALDRQGIEIPSLNNIDIHVVYTDSSLISEAFKLTTRLRNSGINTTIEYSYRKLKKQLSSAASIGSRYCLLLGQDELVRNHIIIRDLSTSTQDTISIDNIEKYLKDNL